jgi:hypothetical protein
MDWTNNLVIKEYDNPRYPRKPFILFLAGYGPVGDRFNCESGYNGVRWPANASDHFETLEEAIEAHKKLMLYVEDKIKQAAKSGSSSTGKSRRPSYYLWR